MTSDAIRKLNADQITGTDTFCYLTTDELESVSAGSYYVGSGVSPAPSLAKMTCEDRTRPNGNSYTYCYW